MKVFFLGFLRGLVLFFLKNNFSEMFIFAILLLCIFDPNSISYLMDTEVRYTIQLESGALFTENYPSSEYANKQNFLDNLSEQQKYLLGGNLRRFRVMHQIVPLNQ